MSDTMKIAALALAILAGLGLSTAEARDGRPAMDFSTLDADGSGEITAEDAEALRDSRFAAVDANGDGAVTLEEFQAHAATQATDRAAEMFARLDADGDGTLSRDVLERGGRRGGDLTRLIERFDTDNSGGISEEEFTEARDRMRERMGGRHGDRDGRHGRN